MIERVVASVSDLFFNPEKRVFIGYLASAWVIGILWLCFSARRSVGAALRHTFDKNTWLGRSARADYALLVINRVVMSFITPALIGQLAIATFWFHFLHNHFSPGAGHDVPRVVILSAFTITLFMFDDASRYWVHRWMHRSPWLWPFHRVHHSAETLTPLTIFRTHPVEGVIYVLRSAVVQGCSIGIFVFVFGDKVDLISILGINVVIFAFNALGANLRHSNVPLHYPAWLEKWLISPAQHHIHHSVERRHHDRNFGVVLAIWDRMGNTLHPSEPDLHLRFGAKLDQSSSEHTLLRLYFQPFVSVFSRVPRTLRSLRQWVFNTARGGRPVSPTSKQR
ncbi:MAG: sterol desaturase family protein [Pseudomonadota bacterium]